jgi:hypothetical protein
VEVLPCLHLDLVPFRHIPAANPFSILLLDFDRPYETGVCSSKLADEVEGAFSSNVGWVDVVDLGRQVLLILDGVLLFRLGLHST